RSEAVGWHREIPVDRGGARPSEAALDAAAEVLTSARAVQIPAGMLGDSANGDQAACARRSFLRMERAPNHGRNTIRADQDIPADNRPIAQFSLDAVGA